MMKEARERAASASYPASFPQRRILCEPAQERMFCRGLVFAGMRRVKPERGIPGAVRRQGTGKGAGNLSGALFLFHPADQAKLTVRALRRRTPPTSARPMTIMAQT